MAGKKKSGNASYEYFKVSDVFINGKYRDYVDKMWEQNKIQNSLFKRLVDLYAIAAIIGLKKGRALPDDLTGDRRTIQMAQLSEAYQTLNPIMKLVLMLDESRGLNEEERIRSAFRIPETREEHDANMELFNSYVRGGIDYLYHELVLRTQGDDDEYSDNRINNIVALLKNPIGTDDIL